MSMCPDCGLGLKPSAKRCSCGWELPQAIAAGKPDASKLCADGCGAPGVYSKDGRRWYCRAHDPWTLARGGRVVGPPGGFESLHAILARHRFDQDPDPEAAAERAAIQADGA